MGTVVKTVFEENFLISTHQKLRTKLTDLKIMQLLSEIWCADGKATQEAYQTSLSHCLQHYRPVQIEKRKKESARKVNWEENVDLDDVGFEFRDSSAAKVVKKTPTLGKRKSANAPKPTERVEIVTLKEEPAPEPEILPPPAKRVFCPVRNANNQTIAIYELPEALNKGRVLKVTAENVGDVENLMKTNGKARDAIVGRISCPISFNINPLFPLLQIAQIKQWKGDNYNIKALDNVMKHLFCNDYLTQFRKNFSQEQNDFFNNNLVVSELRNIWMAGSASAESFTSILRYCVQLARSRAESNKPTHAESVFAE
jgi:hypothetical protein